MGRTIARQGPIAFALVSGDIGGGQRIALSVARRLVHLGLPIAAFAPTDGSCLEEFEALGAECWVTGALRTYDLPAVRRSARRFEEIECSAVYTHTVPAHEAFVGLAARMSGTRLVIHRHLSGIFSSRPIIGAYQKWLWTKAVRYASEVICVSAQVCDDLQIITGGTGQIVPNGIRIPNEVSRHDAGRGALVGFIGRIDRMKRVEDVIRAAALVGESFPDARFQIVGGGPPGDSYARECKELVASLGLQARVTLTGPRPGAAELMETFDVFVLPSVLEGHPLVLLEAMARATPLVVTDIPGHRETVVAGEHALVVPPRDPSALAAAINKLLDSADLRRKLGAAARERAQSLYSEDQMVDALIPLVVG